MRIALLEPLLIPEDMLTELVAPLKARGHEVTVYAQKAASEGELLLRARDMDAVIIANTPFPDTVVRACERLKLIDVAFTGVDHVAMDACRARDIAVCNAANYSNQAVAELTVGMAICLLRRVQEADAAARCGKTSAGLAGGEIAGRTVGIIGMGRIGLRVARLMNAFGARIVACDSVRSSEAVSLGVQYAQLSEVLAVSDIVTLHAPSLPETRHLMGKEQFAQMKKSAVFINCARGALVDAQALCNALNAGEIAGAAVDVFDREPPLDESEALLQAKNILLTPHIAYLSEEAMVRRARIAFHNLTAWLDGEPVNLC